MPETAEATTATATELVGRHFRVRDHYDVGREKIREFARAVRNNHPAHHIEADAMKLGYEGLIASPTFASVIGAATTRSLIGTVLTEYDVSQTLHTDQVFEFLRPIVAGDRLAVDVVVEQIRSFGDNDFITVKVTLNDVLGLPVLVSTTTIVARKGVEIDPSAVETVAGVVMHGHISDAGESAVADPTGLVLLSPDEVTEFLAPAPARPVHTVPTAAGVAAGDELPAVTMPVTRGDLVNYAGVSGDPNPIHFSDAAAKLVGLPTVVAHGMLTMGLTASYLTSWLGDPSALSKFSVRFSGYVPVEPTAPTMVEFTGKVKSADAERGTATIVLGATSEGKKLFGRAVAEVRLS
ncbi:fused (3R)-hydroxyacyl-ACP dehydratase subunits HadA/HadB [Nocardia huaxiensis]|uniref:MaoC family dehydratase N-terminal domain-containing protein n=1 Tax=Nocardia huaxiensis TaxID=2755382 RepID=A0A7D6ZH37_9NOCA|nr:fused (3R)-hydroxyacyl-ACP dehydratase subunits HadA/HadB [Nocardia huaxiensis]QLY30779.1 MaoC family dehydratase N-terminal domain-containing protein [Nocardia huaxiensis]UFS94272.1 MaoC family dehydratase N-terminal domain-containing protein [Nocardia huaxiensis]